MKKFTGNRGLIMEIIEKSIAYKRGEFEILHEGRTVVVYHKELKHFGGRRITSELQRNGFYCTLIKRAFGDDKRMVLSVKTNMRRRDDRLA